jgi:hypothetical protein
MVSLLQGPLKLPAVVLDAGSTGGKAQAKSVLIVDPVHDLPLRGLSRPLCEEIQ